MPHKFLLLCIVTISLAFSSCKKDVKFKKNEGYIFGTTYHFTYESNEDLEKELVRELQAFNHSLSTYDKQSIISRINQNDSTVETDAYFNECFITAKEISELTNGAFDLTVAPIVNAWGFGFDESIQADSAKIDSLMKYVGYEKITLHNNKLIKQYNGTQLDASAIAKGMGVDVASSILDKYNIDHYMVEIGGEVRAKGNNPKGVLWRIGIDKPIEDKTAAHRQLEAVVSLKNKSLATSGNYRQFYEKDGVKYSHTINPKTGFPARNTLLSASVLAKTCMRADAFATAFMVMGTEKTIELSQSLDNIEVYLIYTDSTSKNKIYASEGFKKYIN